MINYTQKGKEKKKTGKKVHKDKPVVIKENKLITITHAMSEWKKEAKEIIKDTDFDMLINPTAYINGVIFKPTAYALQQKNRKEYRNSEDLMKLYDSFTEVMNELAQKTKYTPTLTTFCIFCGFTRNRFMAWCDENNDRGETCAFIKQSLEENFCQGMLNGNIKETSGIFVAKSVFGLKDGDTPQVNIMNVNTTHSVDDILKELNSNLMLSGKNLIKEE